MQTTIFTVLTDEQARDDVAIESMLDQEFSVGVPWYNRQPEL